jgi:hypothetical protein
MTDYTEKVSGFNLEGSWKEIVAHGEKISQILEAIDEVEDNFEDELEEYNEWRPKFEEKIDTDIAEKTAEKASLNENGVEESSKSPKSEIKEATKKISDGTKQADKPDKAAEDFRYSLFYLSRAIRLLARKSMRQSEEIIYENIMTYLSPYYFDNDLISANIKKTGSETYQLEVNINKDDIKEVVSDRMKEMKSADSWNVDIDIETSNVQDAEGINDANNNRRTN